MAAPIHEYVITDHARFEGERRGIAESILQAVLANPEQRFSVRPGRDVLQSRVTLDHKIYLVRVFVDVDRKPPEVVTIYLTSHVAKYWRT
jgi:hypothetical protein